MYSNFYNDAYEPTLPALIAATLLDSASTCSNKTKQDTYIIASTFLNEQYKQRVQVVYDMYFLRVISESEDTDDTLKELLDYFQNKK